MKFAVYCLLAGASAVAIRQPIEETMVQTKGDERTNWPNTKWSEPSTQPNFAGAPERVHVLDPVAF
jgi:hypothetical protein